MKSLFCVLIAASVASLAACSSGSGASNVPMTNSGVNGPAQPLPPSSTSNSSASILATLVNEQTIGSTVPSNPKDGNPYGLDVAKIGSGMISAGDLVVCNFNNPGNIQGTGTTIVALHPNAGATPVLIAKNNALTGCDALAMAPNGQIWTADFSANDNAVFDGSGGRITTLPGGPFDHPFGEAFVPPNATLNNPTYYVSNAGDGSLVRVTVMPGPSYAFTTIATGFPVNHGAPGSILGPSGLNYQPAGDRLYVVDGQNNALYAIDRVSSVGDHGIVIGKATCTGPNAANVSIVYAGAPFNGPISSAILPGGNIAVGNTLDPDGKNLIVEVSPGGKLLDVKNVDTGPAGAIFGMVATGTSASDTRLYFNDDNANAVMVLSR